MEKEKIKYYMDNVRKIGLKKYPNEAYCIFGLPVRYNRNYYQVWTGKRWYKLEIKTL